MECLTLTLGFSYVSRHLKHNTYQTKLVFPPQYLAFLFPFSIDVNPLTQVIRVKLFQSFSTPVFSHIPYLFHQKTLSVCKSEMSSGKLQTGLDFYNIILKVGSR